MMLSKIENKELNIQEYEEKKISLKSFPRIMQLDTTSCCNMDPPCVMCWRANPLNSSHGDHIDINIVKKIQPFLKYLDVLSLHSGGEPFTYPYLFELIENTDKGTKIIFKTNGVLLTHEKIINLVKHKVYSVSFSLDAATSETYNKIRPGANFSKVITNIKDLIEYKKLKKVELPEIKINMTLMRQNIEELPQFVELAKDLGISEIQLKRLNKGRNWIIKRNGFEFDYEKQHLCNFKELNDVIMKKTYEKAMESNIKIHFWGTPFYKERIINKTNNEKVENPWKLILHVPKGKTEISQCKDPWQKVYITYFGLVRFCCSQSVLGDFRKQSLQEIWNSRKVRKIRKKILSNKIPKECKSIEYKCAYLDRE